MISVLPVFMMIKKTIDTVVEINIQCLNGFCWVCLNLFMVLCFLVNRRFCLLLLLFKAAFIFFDFFKFRRLLFKKALINE